MTPLRLCSKVLWHCSPLVSSVRWNMTFTFPTSERLKNMRASVFACGTVLTPAPASYGTDLPQTLKKAMTCPKASPRWGEMDWRNTIQICERQKYPPPTLTVTYHLRCRNKAPMLPVKGCKSKRKDSYWGLEWVTGLMLASVLQQGSAAEGLGHIPITVERDCSYVQNSLLLLQNAKPFCYASHSFLHYEVCAKYED